MKYLVFVEQCRVIPNEIAVAEMRSMMYRIFPGLDLKHTRVLRVEEIEDDGLPEDDLLFFANFVIEFQSENLQKLLPFGRALDDYGIRMIQ